MSTIEKAAEKLAARSKLGAASLRRATVATGLADAESAEPLPHEPVMQGKAQGFIEAPEHFCDINLKHLVEKGYLRPGEGRSQLAQEMRRIKRPLLLNIQKQQAKADQAPPANLIMVASSLPEEGKTFISINLAISMAAELDRRVLLVDADVSKGDITGQLGILANRGLSDLLHETNYLGEDAVLASNVERLSILPAGGNTDHIDELFASELMERICQHLAAADPDRIVIFDSPPLLATTEAAVLAKNMGQIVVVVEANKTPQDAVGQSVQLLEGCANVSLLLNKTTQRDSSNYGYGYGYTRAKRRPAEAQNSETESHPDDSAEERH
jgi:receptor protein-tyrosine kinase